MTSKGEGVKDQDGSSLIMQTICQCCALADSMPPEITKRRAYRDGIKIKGDKIGMKYEA